MYKLFHLCFYHWKLSRSKIHFPFCCDLCVHVWYISVQITYWVYISRVIFVNYCGSVPSAAWSLLCVTDCLLCELATVVTSCCVGCQLPPRSLSNFQVGCSKLPAQIVRPVHIHKCIYAVILVNNDCKKKIVLHPVLRKKKWY